MRLIAIEYPERRLNFFKERLAAAHRRLNWSMKHNPDWNDHAEKGEVVSFYEWAVKMAETAEADVAPVVHGRWFKTDCGMREVVNTGEVVRFYLHDCSVCGYHTGNQGRDFNYYPICGERMDGE